MYLVDYHIHSLYSDDSDASIEDIVEQALSRKIDEIAITDHFEVSNSGQEQRNYAPKGQRLALEELQERYGNRIILRQGVELGQPHHFPEETARFLNGGAFDYVIGSTHKNLRGLDVGLTDYRLVNLEDMIYSYLKEVRLMVEDGQFDCLGHLDLPRRYAAMQGISFSFIPYRKIISEIFTMLIEEGKGIEINTSGIRKKLKSFMPEFELVKLYKAVGGSIVTVGSDAHSHEQVGADVMLAYDMLRCAGFKEVTVYKDRMPEAVAIDVMTTAKYKAI